MHPMHVRYQAALRPDSEQAIIGHSLFFHQKRKLVTSSLALFFSIDHGFHLRPWLIHFHFER